jgi:branched-chain amino acid transport system substrate-binding protein
LTKPKTGDPGEPEIYRPTGKRTFVRVVPADDLQAPCAAKWAQDLGVRHAYVLDDNEIYGKGIATLFIEACQNLGIEVLGHESIDAKAQEFKSLMTTIKAQNPDLVYFGGTTQSKGGQIAKDMMAVGLDCKMMVPDGCYEKAFITSAGAENVNDRCYVTFGGSPGEAFAEKYERRFKSKPEAYAIYGYESAKVALESIRRAGKKDRAAIVAACLAIADFNQGALGTWSFDENGDTTLVQIAGYLVHDGDFKFDKLLDR